MLLELHKASFLPLLVLLATLGRVRGDAQATLLVPGLALEIITIRDAAAHLIKAFRPDIQTLTKQARGTLVRELISEVLPTVQCRMFREVSSQLLNSIKKI